MDLKATFKVEMLCHVLTMHVNMRKKRGTICDRHTIVSIDILLTSNTLWNWSMQTCKFHRERQPMCACEPLPPKTTSTTCKYNDKNATINVIYLKTTYCYCWWKKVIKKKNINAPNKATMHREQQLFSCNSTTNNSIFGYVYLLIVLSSCGSFRQISKAKRKSDQLNSGSERKGCFLQCTLCKTVYFLLSLSSLLCTPMCSLLYFYSFF